MARHPLASVERLSDKSWIAPDIARAPRLLFITDSGTNELTIYAMPAMTLEGTITGLHEPQGECSDSAGNIWLAETATSKMLLYSRTGKLLRTLHVSGEDPAGCAVNPNNGDLAVANIASVGSGRGNVLIYPHATGTPKAYSNRAQARNFFAGYDPSGNLYVDGVKGLIFEQWIMSELPAGGSSLQTFHATGGAFFFPGFVQWDKAGKYLAVADQACDFKAPCIYRVSVSGLHGRVVGKTTIKNYSGSPVCEMIQGVIVGGKHEYVAGGDFENNCGYTPSTVNRWRYDAGGEPTNYNNTTVVLPNGAAVSTK